MKSLLFCVVILSIGSCAAQVKWSQLKVDSLQKYSIEGQGKLYKSSTYSPADTINADLIINNDLSERILLADAMKKGDSIVIVISATNPAYHHEYRIVVKGIKYKVQYHLLTSGDDADRKFFTKNSLLLLNSASYEHGDIIRGYTEYSGECLIGCEKKWVQIKGSFAAKLIVLN